jgi:hypothetical protein
MSGGVRHPFSRILYEPDGTGFVRLTAKDGRTGRFRGDGRWVDGEIDTADPELCVWVSAKRATHHRLSAQST